MAKDIKIITTKYNIKTPCRLALVTDLHEHDPKGVLEILKNEKPDIICVAGDTMERFDLMRSLDLGDMSFISRLMCHIIHGVDKVLKDVFKYEPKNVCQENAYEFLEQAATIAPVVMSRGNHEQFYLPEDDRILKNKNIHILDNEYQAINGICFCGFSSVFDESKYDQRFLEDFEAQQGYKILLMHHPEYYERFLTKEGIFRDDIDLIMSGHCHGGQVRVFGHGLFAPGQGLFPRYHHGLYDGHFIVSAGVANTAIVPRWGNPPEVIIIEE